MTPGQEAMIEAMRVEQAKIYGQLCRESTASSTHVYDEPRRDPKVTDIRVARNSRKAS